VLDFVRSQFIPVQHTEYVLKYWWSWLGRQVVPFVDGYKPAAFIFWIDVPLNNRETLTFHLVEIPTRCSFVIEFIIPKFFEGSACFEWHTAHHQEL